MKNKLLILVIILGSILSGCTSTAEEKVTLGTKTQTTQITNESNQKDERKKQQKSNDLFREIGEVTKVVGNEITLKLIKVQQITDTENVPERSSKDKIASGQAKFPGGGQTGRKAKVEYTGEVATIIIPVGTPIYSRSMNGQEKVELEEITSGSKLTLLYNSDQKDITISERIIKQITLVKGR